MGIGGGNVSGNLIRNKSVRELARRRGGTDFSFPPLPSPAPFPTPSPRMVAYYLEPFEAGMYVSDEPGYYKDGECFGLDALDLTPSLSA